MGFTECPLESVEMTLSSYWSNTPVLVTGATGIVGSWLCAELLKRGAGIIALIKDADPQSELIKTGNINRLTVVNGNLEDYWTVESAINQHDIQVVFHLGAQAIVGSAFR